MNRDANGHFVVSPDLEQRVPYRRPARQQFRPDIKSSWFFSFCFVLMVGLSVWQPLLDVRTMYNGIAIDRRTLSLFELFFMYTPKMTHPAVAVCLILFNV